jgi:hypothetical protein
MMVQVSEKVYESFRSLARKQQELQEHSGRYIYSIVYKHYLQY